MKQNKSTAVIVCSDEANGAMHCPQSITPAYNRRRTVREVFVNSLLGFITSLLICVSFPTPAAGEVIPPVRVGAQTFPTFSVDPSSASLAGGRASLIVKPLIPEVNNYVADYQLIVRPYSFKSETGKIAIAFTEKSLLSLREGKPVNFSGTATTNGSNKTRPIKGTATPSGSDRGSVTFSIPTGSGFLVFVSNYRIGSKPE